MGERLRAFGMLDLWRVRIESVSVRRRETRTSLLLSSPYILLMVVVDRQPGQDVFLGATGILDYWTVDPDGCRQILDRLMRSSCPIRTSLPHHRDQNNNQFVPKTRSCSLRWVIWYHSNVYATYVLKQNPALPPDVFMYTS